VGPTATVGPWAFKGRSRLRLGSVGRRAREKGFRTQVGRAPAWGGPCSEARLRRAG